MNAAFASPAMLWGLVALGALTAIYFLRLRSRRVVVSSLLLWVDHRNVNDGGRTVKRLKTPLLYFLELLILTLLILAAAGLYRSHEGSIPLLIIVDDSYSMRAATVSEQANEDAFAPDSPRMQAELKLAKLLESESIRANVIVAGHRPVLLGETFSSADSLLSLRKRWSCLQPSADLASAIVLARQLDADARIDRKSVV